ARHKAFKACLSELLQGVIKTANKGGHYLVTIHQMRILITKTNPGLTDSLHRRTRLSHIDANSHDHQTVPLQITRYLQKNAGQFGALELNIIRPLERESLYAQGAQRINKRHANHQAEPFERS